MVAASGRPQPSLRFLGRKIYLAKVVMLISAMLLGTTPDQLRLRRFRYLRLGREIEEECTSSLSNLAENWQFSEFCVFTKGRMKRDNLSHTPEDANHCCAISLGPTGC